MRSDILGKKDVILSLIENKVNKGEIARVLNCRFGTLDSYLKKMGIEYKGNQSRLGSTIPKTYIDSSHYLYKGSSIQSNVLKKKLIKDKILEAECSSCKLSDWQGKSIPLELDHIDGDNTNNELENLRILCPNCHAFTDTYRGKNKKTARSAKEVNEMVDSLANTKIVETKICLSCNVEYSKSDDFGKGKYYCSNLCYNKMQEKFELTADELKELVWKYPSTKIALMYGVSDKAIEKRCKKYNIDKPPRGYWMKNKGT